MQQNYSCLLYQTSTFQNLIVYIKYLTGIWLNKVSYSCIENVSQIIKKHNKRVIKTNKRSIATSNCRDRNHCSMNGNCRVKNQLTYRNMFILMLLKVIGSRATTITPYHSEIRNTNDTAPSTFLWELTKSTKETPKLSWSVLKVVPGYLNIKVTIK